MSPESCGLLCEPFERGSSSKVQVQQSGSPIQGPTEWAFTMALDPIDQIPSFSWRIKMRSNSLYHQGIRIAYTDVYLCDVIDPTRARVCRVIRLRHELTGEHLPSFPAYRQQPYRGRKRSLLTLGEVMYNSYLNSSPFNTFQHLHECLTVYLKFSTLNPTSH